jgi:oxygen-independent coproporphyrinogen-3 oxidase
MEALELQLKFELKKLNNQTLKSIFIGGGTPSCVDSIYYKNIFTTLQPYITKDTEITTEANPNSASKDWLKNMKSLGVNRVSFGVQSFDNDKLKFLGRNHNKNQAIQAIKDAKEVGFEHINCDIIYDTIKDTKELISKDLDIIKTLPIDHISAYSLTIEEGTKFFDKTNVKIENIDMAQYIFDTLLNFGFQQYEISNFAKTKTSKSIHNFGYWEKDDYLGVGAGAVGAIKNKRYYPQKDVQKYIQNPLKYELIEDLDLEDIRFEKIFLGLRSDVGVKIDILKEQERKKLDILVKEDKLTIKNNKFYNNNFLITDEIVMFLI